MRYLALLSLLLLSYKILIAQQINGFVSDVQTGERLIGAHVYTINEKTASITNNFGYFTIKVEEADSLFFSYVGYQNTKIKPQSNYSKPIQIKLYPDNLIDEVVVHALKPLQETPEMGLVNISVKQLKTLPAIMGETDIMKSLQLMPGIKPVGEGQSSFMVRGGSPDQNMIILDNVPMYYIHHLGGFVSVFNTNAINNVKMYKAGFPARYGGRLSSIIDVNTKDGNLEERHASLTLGMITSKLLMEGPVKKDTSSYMLSIRRFMYDLVTRPVTYITNGKTQSGYTFYDINAKMNFKPNAKNRIFFSFYSGHDKMLTKNKERREEKTMLSNIGKWGNLAASFRWNHLLGSKFFSNITAYYMQFKYKSAFKFSFEEDGDKYETSSVFSSGINDLSINSDFEYYPISKLQFRFGTNHIYHTYKPNNYEYIQPVFEGDSGSFLISSIQKTKLFAFENAAYVEFNYFPIKEINFNLGIRGSSYTTGAKTYFAPEPRAIINFNLSGLFSVKGSYTSMKQYVHLLTYFGIGVPADLWMPSTDKVPPQNSEMYSVGLYKSLQKFNVDISVEAYYKTMGNLIEYKSGYSVFSSGEDWVNAVETNGLGVSKGLEFLAQRKSGQLSGWISYTLSRTTRQFQNINNGAPYLYTYDATHDFSIVSSYLLNKNLTLSVIWVYTTGRAITLSNMDYNTALYGYTYENYTKPVLHYDNTISVYEQKNNIRMSPYHRLDISITYKKHKKRSDRILSLGIYNLYNRQNAVYYYVGTKTVEDAMGRPIGNTEKVLYQISLFPILPSISYTWMW